MRCKYVCIFLPSILGLLILGMFLLLQFDSKEYYEQCLHAIEVDGNLCADFIPSSSILFGIILLILTYICQCILFLFNKSILKETKVYIIWLIIYPVIIALTLFLLL